METGFHATTDGIRVDVGAFFLDDQSDPASMRFVWAYQVKISNLSQATVQLMRRTWRITDAHGQVNVVEGEGVVGKQPVLRPGESFEYTSGTPLQTPSGFMTGTYHMVNAGTGDRLDIAIPAFSLDSPYQSGRIH